MLLTFLLVATGVFCCANSALGAGSSYAGLAITEIMYNPAGNNTEHAKWVELANLSSGKITLNPTGSKTASGWKIKDLKITDLSNHYLYTQDNTPIEINSGDFIIITDNLINFGNDYSDFTGVPILKSAISLTAADSSGNYNLALYDNTSILDAITYSKDWYKNTDDKGKSLEKIDSFGKNGKENWQESCIAKGTPGEEPKICEKEIDTADESGTKNNSSGETGNTGAGTGENFSSAENVYLNEIFPNPKKDSDEEYVEIVNGESGPVDLYGWVIRDGSKSGKYTFKEHMEIRSGECLVVYKSQSKIALNNSAESVSLYNPKGKITSSVSYEKSRKNSSYSFDGKNWRWSKYATPGEKNKFDAAPSIKIKKPKSVYKDILAEFSAKAKDKDTKKLKYVWDFGDGKKSYLAKTSHKYLNTGKYTVTLSVSDDSQTVDKNFVIAVKNSPRPNLEIVKIIPNPAGSDSEGEIVEIHNSSGEKAFLDGWKIATGSGEKMYNHPISDGIILDAGETKTITREMSKFFLNNKAGKIALVSPDGKMIDDLEYEKEKIAEGEAYAKIDGEWQWIAADSAAEIHSEPTPGEEIEFIDDPTGEKQSAEDKAGEAAKNNSGAVLGAADENVPFYAPTRTGYTPEDEFIFFQLFGLLEYKPQEANFCPAVQPANTLAYF